MWGLGTVRLDVMGMEDRPPTAEELRLMEESVARCMEEGARGISAGLIYTPNKYQSTEELVALAKVAARYDGILDVHMRNEGDHMAEASEEMGHQNTDAGFAPGVGGCWLTQNGATPHLLDRPEPD